VSVAVPARVWGATAGLALGRQWGALCAILALARLARALPADEFGRLAFWLAAFAFVDVLVDSGTSTVALTQSAQGEREFAAALAGGRRQRAVASALAAILLLAGAWLSGERQLGWLAWAALTPFSRVAELSAVAFQREIAWSQPVTLRALGASLRLAATLALAELGVDTFGPYLALHLGLGALGNLGLHLAARARLPARAAPRAGLLALTLPVALLGLVQQAYFWIDHLFVRATLGAAELGRYSACVKVFAWLVFASAVATGSALPWLARRHAEGALADALTRLATPLVLLASGAAGFLWPLADEVLFLTFGQDFVPAAPSLRGLLLAAVAVAGGAVALTGLLAAGRARAALGVGLGALAVNLAANAWLVPRHGAPGAALATLATELTVLLASVAILVRLGLRSPLPRGLLAAPPLAALALLVGTLVAPLFPH